jgi:outer membrane protein assembly factor BamA
MKKKTGRQRLDVLLVERGLVLRGIDQAAQKAIWPSLVSKPGEAYSPERAQADRDRILAYFADRGYVRASATWQASTISPEHETDLEYQVEPGTQERIRRVVILGDDHTRESVILRELTLREGEPLRQSDLLESQRRLYDLGVFNQVQITKQDIQNPQTPQTILVGLEEARRWTVGYGGGIEVQRLGSNQPQGQLQASPRLSLDLTRLNVGGLAQTFAIHGTLSNLERGGGLIYLVPHLFNHRDLTLRLNGLVDRSRDVLTFNADRREGSVSVEKRFTSNTLVVGRYSFRRVQLWTFPRESPPSRFFFSASRRASVASEQLT